MDFVIVGLGNPGEKYDKTRHNIGRDVLEKFRKKHSFSEWDFDKKKEAQISKGKFGKDSVTLVLPETYMNDSGKAVRFFVKNKKQANNTLVVYDELDLAIGKMKISFNKSSGGHKGVQSIINHIKTQEFARLRIGIAPVTPSGKIKKVLGEEKVVKHVLSKFKPNEKKNVDKAFKNGVTAVELSIEQGHEGAANEVNGW